VLTRARVGPPASGASMDRSVRQLVTDALAVYDIDTELLAALGPRRDRDPGPVPGSARSASTMCGPRSPAWPPGPTCGWSACIRAAWATSSTTSPGSPPRSAARPPAGGWWPRCATGSSRDSEATQRPWRAAAAIPQHTEGSRLWHAEIPPCSTASRTCEPGQEHPERALPPRWLRPHARPASVRPPSDLPVRVADPAGPAPPPATCGQPEARRASA